MQITTDYLLKLAVVGHGPVVFAVGQEGDMFIFLLFLQYCFPPCYYLFFPILSIFGDKMWWLNKEGQVVKPLQHIHMFSEFSRKFSEAISLFVECSYWTSNI